MKGERVMDSCLKSRKMYYLKDPFAGESVPWYLAKLFVICYVRSSPWPSNLPRRKRKCGELDECRGKTPEKAMAPHSSTLAWKIPWMEEPGRLQSMGSQRVGHDWATSLSLFTFHFHALEKEMATHSSVLDWRIPGTGCLVGFRLWGRTESDTTEVT